ncbi:hypothetical protein ACVWY2_003437 [Bradyrhizobium sp. JR6.1]
MRRKVGFDGLVRISTQTLLDTLEVPQRDRTAGTYRHLAKVMAELGWAAIEPVVVLFGTGSWLRPGWSRRFLSWPSTATNV